MKMRGVKTFTASRHLSDLKLVANDLDIPMQEFLFAERELVSVHDTVTVTERTVGFHGMGSGQMIVTVIRTLVYDLVKETGA